MVPKMVPKVVPAPPPAVPVNPYDTIEKVLIDNSTILTTDHFAGIHQLVSLLPANQMSKPEPNADANLILLLASLVFVRQVRAGTQLRLSNASKSLAYEEEVTNRSVAISSILTAHSMNMGDSWRTAIRFPTIHSIRRFAYDLELGKCSMIYHTHLIHHIMNPATHMPLFRAYGPEIMWFWNGIQQ
jgi:hypothetical protein